MTTKREQQDAERLEQALERALAYLKTNPQPRFVVYRPRIDAKEIRESLGMSRQDFAMAFSISLRTLQNWEEGRREPEGPARTLLVAIKYESDAVRRAVQQWRAERDPAAEPEPVTQAARTPAPRRRAGGAGR